ncbi:MAG: tetratricopeptide repeat protein [Deltaproteobacteria bacterium]|nr:tetratricopeptide repeat protein [Deltaproteobacteria bacterium]MBW2378029.1 tetratricopeptide repeat protein [Deltaproteobacteria bacterium]MBW2684490.1 tetratricopeptide repeat protein [Deltaproteobacteria bacterium]
MIRACYITLLLLASPIGVAAQQPVEASGGSSLAAIFEAANIAASRGDHAGAIANYRKLTEAGVHDPDVYFNLATSFAQSGDYARAILHYERALSLRPNDGGKASDNLRAAEKALEEQRAEVEGEAMIRRSSSISDAIFGGLSEDALAIGLLVANLLFFLALGWAAVGRRRNRWLYPLLISSGLALTFCALGLGAKAGLLRDGPRAVALDDRVILREGPDPRAQVRGEARAGDRGQIVDRDRDFVKLRLVSGLEGWTPSSGVGAIDRNDGVH